MANYLLDASALIDWFKARAPVVDLLQEQVRREDILAVNAVAVAEVYSGFSDQERREADSVLAAFEYWEMSVEVARLAGAFRYRYKRLGRPLSLPDMLMAAHAVVRDATLLTGNVRDFPMPELKVLRLP